MRVKEYTRTIVTELMNNLSYLDESQLEELVQIILKSNHLFTAGAGRSGLAIRAFTNRLMHLGFAVNNVGEISCPHTQPGDLLIIGSGSGETESLVAMAKKAQKKGVRIALLTMDCHSAIAQMADVTVVLPGVSPKLKNAGMNITSVQPMGSAFEQLLLLTCDGIILELMEHKKETGETMFQRHADLE